MYANRQDAQVDLRLHFESGPAPQIFARGRRTTLAGAPDAENVPSDIFRVKPAVAPLHLDRDDDRAVRVAVPASAIVVVELYWVHNKT